MKVYPKINTWDPNKWEDLEILNINIKTKIEGGFNNLQGKKIKSERNKTEHQLQINIFNQNNLVTLDIHRKQSKPYLWINRE